MANLTWPEIKEAADNEMKFTLKYQMGIPSLNRILLAIVIVYVMNTLFIFIGISDFRVIIHHSEGNATPP